MRDFDIYPGVGCPEFTDPAAEEKLKNWMSSDAQGSRRHGRTLPGDRFGFVHIE